jgi:NAD(P)-dependent dehydrogenase (short-subunit alcohol dehydrogenase family)
MQYTEIKNMSELFEIKNKVIVISGATGVLGSAMAHYLAGEGATIIVMGRNPDKVQSLVKSIQVKGGDAFAAVADVTEEGQLITIQKELKSRYGSINVLINAAGGNLPGAVIMPDQDLMGSDLGAMQKVMELNYLGTFLPIKIFMPLFLEDRKGSIINISSLSATRPMTRVMGYSSAKAAIDNLTKWLAVEFAHKYGEGMRVNALAPGFFLTEQNRSLLTQEDGSLTTRGKQILNNTPMGRFGSPDELLGTLHWLCCDASSFVTGTIVEVDGGFGAYAGV